jgi:2,3-bisphosphoglycerate-independent phosphoglycerate mutase
MNKDIKPIVLIVLDGWGHREGKEHNAIAEANTPFFDLLWHNYPHTLLNASEQYVGLPTGTIGNSEIGHMTMGAGKVIDTDLVRISKAFDQALTQSNPAFAGLFSHVKKHSSTLHILGLVSDGGVHAHQQHLHDFLKEAKNAGLHKVVIHAFTDGRDVAPQSAAAYLKELEKVIGNVGIGYIATATGRYFSMDRDQNWDRTKKAEDAIFSALGNSYNNQKPSDVLAELYKDGIIDELLEPTIFLDDKGNSYKVADNDGIFFFNFRSDRPRQLSKRIMEHAKEQNLYFVTMTEYDPAIISEVAFPKSNIETTLAAEISQAGLKQSHIAETEKYAHVTFFFNGGRQEPYENEEQILMESRKDVKTHDEAPEMRARAIADAVIERLDAGDNFILINFANADMVGHTANKPAIIIAVETVDTELKRVVEKTLSLDGTIIVTADHGNAEQNIHPVTGDNHTAHTLNQVPFILVSRVSIPLLFKEGLGEVNKSSLADIAPTILNLLEIKKPVAMTGQSLVE